MRTFFKPFLHYAGIAALAALPSFANTTVGLELSLLVDVSGSVTTAEFNLQRGGYVTAFQSAAVQAAIAATPGGIAVNLIYWSGSGQQNQAIGYTQLTNAADANAFATAINGTLRPFSGQTAPGSAINFAVPLFSSNTFDSAKQVIDVSGDGAQNNGANTLAARNAALAAGIDQLNGVVILGEAGLFNFYDNNIKGGAGAFVETAATFADFSDAIQRKLFREISGVPEPASVVLLATMLGLTGFAARKRFARG